jgi:DNA-binding response OmpR family regulator
LEITDERLRYAVRLLLEKEHVLTCDDAELLVTDRATDTSLPTLVIGSPALPRPFSHEALRAAVREALRTPLLTPTETRLYEALRAASPAPVSREQLKRAAFVNGGDDRMLNLYIHYLREKLEQDGIRRIFASRGKGYYLQC